MLSSAHEFADHHDIVPFLKGAKFAVAEAYDVEGVFEESSIMRIHDIVATGIVDVADEPNFLPYKGLLAIPRSKKLIEVTDVVNR